MGNAFDNGLEKSNKKEGHLKRLKSIEDKNEAQLVKNE